jgi:hypothetical protein
MPSKPAKLTAVLFTGVLASACTHPYFDPAGTGGHVTSGSGGAGAGGAGSGGASGTGGDARGSGGNLGGGSGGAGAGGSGSGGTIVTGTGGAPPTRGPTPPHDGINFPFPQNRESPNCTYPQGYRNEDVRPVYDKWYRDMVTPMGTKDSAGLTHLRIQRAMEPGTLEPGSTVSEGIGYGMLIAVYMGDQNLFDELWKYEQMWLGPTGLMDWYINAAGTNRGSNPDGHGPATDADEDMAFALLMADKQWGGKGAQSKNYIDIAKDQISKIWVNEIQDYKYVKPGPWADASKLNISYFAPSYYRLFAKVDTAAMHNWNDAVTSSYDTIKAALNANNKNQNNGLVPAWCDSAGQPRGDALGPGQTAPTNYQYDSCRTPFRIALDWCWGSAATGGMDTRAKDYTAKTSGFFSGIGVANMVDGYNLDGTTHPQWGDNHSSAFVGPAGVGAMTSNTYQTFLDQAYAALTTVAAGKYIAGGTYYDESWAVMSLLMMTGNFLDYTSL